MSDARRMPPEVKGALARLAEVNSNPATTDAEVQAAVSAECYRIIREADPEVADLMGTTRARVRDLMTKPPIYVIPQPGNGGWP